MQKLKFLANQALGPRILVSNGAPRGGSVPSQGARSEYNLCNINMLAIHKQNAVPKNGTLSGTRARGHDPGLLGPTKGDGSQGHGPGSPDHRPCALDLGPLVLAV